MLKFGDVVQIVKNIGRSDILSVFVEKAILAIALVLFATMSGCALPNSATAYQPEGLAGGFGEEQIAGKDWHVHFYGNSFTHFETAETYWLYHCAELALAKGFDGFSIIQKSELLGDGSKPAIDGTISLLKGRVTPVPGKTFDARYVQSKRESSVNGKKCEFGNVCGDNPGASAVGVIFSRMTVFNLTKHIVTLTVSNEKYSLPPTGGAATMEYPQESQNWRLEISAEDCTYLYEMPRDLTNAPWRVYRGSDATIPFQLANDFSLHAVPPHPGPWSAEGRILTTQDWRAPVIPKEVCQ